MTHGELVAEQPEPSGGLLEVWPELYAVATRDVGVSAKCLDVLLSRRELGKQRYGAELRTHNGRNAKADLVQELADAAFYACQMSMEDGTGDTILRGRVILQLLDALVLEEP